MMRACVARLDAVGRNPGKGRKQETSAERLQDKECDEESAPLKSF